MWDYELLPVPLRLRNYKVYLLNCFLFIRRLFVYIRGGGEGAEKSLKPPKDTNLKTKIA